MLSSNVNFVLLKIGLLSPEGKSFYIYKTLLRYVKAFIDVNPLPKIKRIGWDSILKFCKIYRFVLIILFDLSTHNYLSAKFCCKKYDLLHCYIL